MAPSSSLLAGFVVQRLLAVSLCQLALTEEDVTGNTAGLGTSSRPCSKIWVGECEGTTDVS